MRKTSILLSRMQSSCLPSDRQTLLDLLSLQVSFYGLISLVHLSHFLPSLSLLSHSKFQEEVSEINVTRIEGENGMKGVTNELMGHEKKNWRKEEENEKDGLERHTFFSNKSFSRDEREKNMIQFITIHFSFLLSTSFFLFFPSWPPPLSHSLSLCFL